MAENDAMTAYDTCEACGTPTPVNDLEDVQTPIRPLTACPTCRPSGVTYMTDTDTCPRCGQRAIELVIGEPVCDSCGWTRGDET